MKAFKRSWDEAKCILQLRSRARQEDSFILFLTSRIETPEPKVLGNSLFKVEF
jgi:hypothetical protein